MKIRIDATSLLVRSAGVKTHNWQWIRALREAAGKRHDITAFPLVSDIGELTHTGSVMGPAATLARLGLLAFLNLPGNPGINLLTGNADVFHASNMVRNPPTNVALTATLYDLTCALMPELHTPGNIRADRFYTVRILPRARRIIANSESTRLDAMRLLRLDPERIETIPPGVDARFFDAAPAPAAKPYVLYLGTIEPRKNIDTLIDAWTALPADLRDEYDLIVAGSAGWNSAATMERLRNTQGVRLPGYIAEADLPGLTAAATLFVYPSLYEGFGLPPAQAMAARVPVVTSNVSSLPEVAGDAAVQVDPRSTAELTAAIADLLTSPAKRSDLSRRGRERAARFTWEQSARQSLAFFERAAS